MNFLSTSPGLPSADDPAGFRAAAPVIKPDGARSRCYGADLLRIVSMLMILTSHFFVIGKSLGALNPSDVNFYFGWFIESCCYVMVDCFVLITGYFQPQSKFRLKKFLLLWGQVIAVSGGIYIILVLAGKQEYSPEGLYNALTPITGSRYWFATAYLIFYALTPLINFALDRADRKQHFTACAVLWGLFIIGRNFFYWVDFANLHGGYTYTFFVVLYVTAAYLRKYPPKKRRWLAWYFFFSAVTAASRIGMTILYYKFRFDSVYVKMFTQYNSFPVAAASVCLFLFFVNLNIRGRVSRALIGFFAPLTFGVYLIHEQDELKAIYWPLLNPAQYARSPKLFLVLPLTVLSLFLVCSLLEFLRRKLSRALKIPELFGAAADLLGRFFSRMTLRFLPPEE